MKRGKSGSFRVLCYYREQNDTVYPFFIYTKMEYEKNPGEQPPAKEIKLWISDLQKRLASGHMVQEDIDEPPPPGYTCPNCGPLVGLSTMRAEFEIFLECPDCQRTYTPQVQRDGTMLLVVVSSY